jgi:dCMP deaminase
LNAALAQADLSKDPRTRVGAVIVDRSTSHTICSGFNQFPSGIREDQARLNDRDTKLRIIVHAEMAAVISAAKYGRSVNGATVYLAATDSTGATWGGCPCTRCTAHLLHAGIAEIVSLPRKGGFSAWHEDLDFAQSLIAEAGIIYREVDIS